MNVQACSKTLARPTRRQVFVEILTSLVKPGTQEETHQDLFLTSMGSYHVLEQ